MGCSTHEDPFKTYLLSKVTFSKIKPKSWQEILCDDFVNEDYIEHITYNPRTGLFNIDIGDSVRPEELVSFAERIIELSEKSSQK